MGLGGSGTRGSFGRDSCERDVGELTRRVVHLWYADETNYMANSA